MCLFETARRLVFIAHEKFHRNETISGWVEETSQKIIKNEVPGRIQWMWLAALEYLQPEKLQVSYFMNFLKPSLAKASSF